jgi:hypothetical protein
MPRMVILCHGLWSRKPQGATANRVVSPRTVRYGRGDLRAYEGTVRLPAPEFVARLRDLLGARLVAHVGCARVGSRSSTSWAADIWMTHHRSVVHPLVGYHPAGVDAQCLHQALEETHLQFPAADGRRSCERQDSRASANLDQACCALLDDAILLSQDHVVPEAARTQGHRAPTLPAPVPARGGGRPSRLAAEPHEGTAQGR